MSTKQSLPYDWVKQIPSSLLEIDSAPLLGHAPDFPWEQFASDLISTFQLDSLTFQSSIPEWRTENEILSGVNGDLTPLHFSLSSLEGTGCWMMSKNDVSTIMSMLMKQQPTFASSLEPSIRTAFTEFLALQVVQSLEKIGFETSLAPQILSKEEFPEGDSLCIDISYSLNGKNFKGRLILSPELQKSWQEHFIAQNIKSADIAGKVNVIVHLEAGNISLTNKQWNKVRKGDLLILDACSIDPDLNKGRVIITYQGIPLYRGMLKKGNLKILENPLYHEVDTHMNDNITADEESEFEFEESEFEEEEYEEEEEEEEEYEDEDDEEEVEYEEEVVVEEEPQTEETVMETTAAPVEEGTTDTAQIPLPIVVEIARLQMSIKQLNELQPGNLLELNIKPEDGIDLVVNGKRIAKAELLRVGETLGARILELG